MIKVICMGFDIYGSSYSAIKRHANVSEAKKEEKPRKNMPVTNGKEISFDEQEKENIQDPHHNGLVITLYIVNHLSEGSQWTEDHQ